MSASSTKTIQPAPRVRSMISSVLNPLGAAPAAFRCQSGALPLRWRFAGTFSGTMTVHFLAVGNLHTGRQRDGAVVDSCGDGDGRKRPEPRGAGNGELPIRANLDGFMARAKF